MIIRRRGHILLPMVTWQWEWLFGEVTNEEMNLAQYGQVVCEAWFDLPRLYRHVELGAFVVIPNHVYGIIILNDDGRGGSRLSGGDKLPGGRIVGNAPSPDQKTRPYAPIKRHGLTEIVRAFKSFSAGRINVLHHAEGMPVWQRNYYEHIIRDEREKDKIWRYIESNPCFWADDHENPAHV